MFDRISQGLWWDKAWSLVGGCTPVSDACDNCWAARQTHMWSNNPNPIISYRNAALTSTEGHFNGRVQLNHEFLDRPLRTRKPTAFAVWNDLFHEDVPFQFIAWAWWVMGQCAGYLDPSRQRDHTFLILTKRPDRMKRWLEVWADQDSRRKLIENMGEVYDWMSGPKYWPDVLPNVWLGVTAENQQAADKRIPILLQTPAAVRFVSVEPMLGPVDLHFGPVPPCSHRGCYNHITHPCEGCGRKQGLLPIDWVICGGESGPGARPIHPDWVRSLQGQCQDAGTAFMLKQWGEWGSRQESGLSLNGKQYGYWENSEFQYQCMCGGVDYMVKVGKKAAGRLLDGREWTEYPEIDR